MLSPTRRIAALCSLALLSSLSAGSATAAGFVSHYPHRPHPAPLPVFGMHSYNDGYGERIVRVRHGGIACQLGLQRGDVIERLNGRPLNYHGTWHCALRSAMANGGHVLLEVRDIRTGRLALRHIDFDPHGHVIEPPGGPVGPITPKARPLAQQPVRETLPPAPQGWRSADPRLSVPRSPREQMLSMWLARFGR